MLKRIVINQKVLPVPVPIRNVDEAIDWIETSMIPDGQTITALSLNGKSLIDLLGYEKELSLIKLLPDSILEVRIEAALDLVLQTIETAHNLSRAILGTIKVVAVNLWQSPVSEEHKEFELLIDDLAMILELVDHSRDLCDSQTVDFGILDEMHIRLNSLIAELKSALEARDWRRGAQVLLRDEGTKMAVESSLKMLQEEFESAHLRLLISKNAKAAGQK